MFFYCENCVEVAKIYCIERVNLKSYTYTYNSISSTREESNSTERNVVKTIWNTNTRRALQKSTNLQNCLRKLIIRLSVAINSNCSGTQCEYYWIKLRLERPNASNVCFYWLLVTNTDLAFTQTWFPPLLRPLNSCSLLLNLSPLNLGRIEGTYCVC